MNMIVIRYRNQKSIVGALLAGESDEMSLCVYMCVEAGVDPSGCQYATLAPNLFGAIFAGDEPGLDDDTKSAVCSIDDKDWIDLPDIDWIGASEIEDCGVSEIKAAEKDLF